MDARIEDWSVRVEAPAYSTTTLAGGLKGHTFMPIFEKAMNALAILRWSENSSSGSRSLRALAAEERHVHPAPSVCSAMENTGRLKEPSTTA